MTLRQAAEIIADELNVKIVIFHIGKKRYIFKFDTVKRELL